MDRIIRAIAADNFIKMSVIDAKDTVQRAVDIHHPSVTASAALGRALCAASLLGMTREQLDREPLPEQAVLLGLRKHPGMTAIGLAVPSSFLTM